MAQIRPFVAFRYARRPDLEVSKLIAPPYDVLDESQRAELAARHPNNIVHIDLPHMPPKAAGPESVYKQANETLQRWVEDAILLPEPRPAFYPYMQTYEHGGRTYHRRGFVALVKLSPFGAGPVVPHELTHKGPIQDRLCLMRATEAQFSPIFGLFNDPRHEITNLIYSQTGKPAVTATLDGVRNDLWSVSGSALENKVMDMMGARNIYIADGHHRYTTALQYQSEMQQAAGGQLPPGHPANWCMFVLVGMQDPGLLILPTHRLIGGLSNFSAETFEKAVSPHFELLEDPFTSQSMTDFADNHLRKALPHTLGVYIGQTRKLFLLRLREPNLLQELEPQRSPAWRQLDVAILQRYLLDEILQKQFAGGQPPLKDYTADPAEIPLRVDGKQFQVALLLQPTPLSALEELGRHGEVMPQKSTYFYPKLATGLLLNPLA